MRKNRMMRLASALLILTMVTTCAISGTFAKYTTTVTGTDTARVARWGFTGQDADIAITDLFTDAYKDTPLAWDADGTFVKAAADNTDIIAPGTTNSATFVFKYDGGTVAAPEVDYNFTVSIAGSEIGDNLKSNTNIKWKLDNGNWGTWDALMNSILGLSGDTGAYDAANDATHSITKKYEAGTLPASVVEEDTVHTISWKWAFDENDDITGFDAGNTDVADTALGNGGLEKVTIKITITATQLD